MNHKFNFRSTTRNSCKWSRPSCKRATKTILSQSRSPRPQSRPPYPPDAISRLRYSGYCIHGSSSRSRHTVPSLQCSHHSPYNTFFSVCWATHSSTTVLIVLPTVLPFSSCRNIYPRLPFLPSETIRIAVHRTHVVYMLTPRIFFAISNSQFSCSQIFRNSLIGQPDHWNLFPSYNFQFVSTTLPVLRWTHSVIKCNTVHLGSYRTPTVPFPCSVDLPISRLST